MDWKKVVLPIMAVLGILGGVALLAYGSLQAVLAWNIGPITLGMLSGLSVLAISVMSLAKMRKG